MFEYIFAGVLVGLAAVWLAYRLLKKGSGTRGCSCCSLRDECSSKPDDERGEVLSAVESKGDSLADDASTGDNPNGE